MGISPDRSLALHAYAQKLISFKARQLIGKAGYRKVDLEDVRQSLLTHLHEKSDQFDPSRGAATTFIARLVDQRIAEILRNRRRKKRKPGFYLMSIEEPDLNRKRDTTPIIDRLSPEFRDRITGGGSSPGLPIEDREAFHQVFQSLSTEQQDLLLRHLNLTTNAVAKAMGISRRQLAKAMQAIRSRFAAAGFDSF